MQKERSKAKNTNISETIKVQRYEQYLLQILILLYITLKIINLCQYLTDASDAKLTLDYLVYVEKCFS